MMSLSFRVYDPQARKVYTGVGYDVVLHEVLVLMDGESVRLDLSKVVVLQETPVRLPDGRPLYEGDVVSVERAGVVTHHVISPMTAVDIIYYENPFHHKVDRFLVRGNEYVMPGLFNSIKEREEDET